MPAAIGLPALSPIGAFGIRIQSPVPEGLASLPFRHNHNHPPISHHIACSPRCCLLSSGHLPTNSEWHLVELYLDAAAASPLLPLCSLRCWPSATCSTRPRPSTTPTASPSRGTQTRTSRAPLADPFSTSARWVRQVICLHFPQSTEGPNVHHAPPLYPGRINLTIHALHSGLHSPILPVPSSSPCS